VYTTNSLNDTTFYITERFRLAVREKRLSDAHELFEALAESNSGVAAQPVFPTMLALASYDAIGAPQALQDGDATVDVLRAICLHALDDPIWQGIVESVIENSGDPVE
jgi:predicted metal-dependent hydrolase